MNLDQELTAPQKELHQYLEQQISRGVQPSQREIMRAMGLKSRSPVRARLDRLERKGYIRLSKNGKARSIQLMRPSFELVPVPPQHFEAVRLYLDSLMASEVNNLTLTRRV